jgi:drug/metabolite transporter, DME family
VRGYLFVLMAAICWGAIGPVSKLAFANGMAPLEVAFWRAVLGWVLFAGHATALREVRVKRGDLLPVLGFGLWGVTIFYGSYQVAVQAGGAALASVLLYTAPAWVVLMARMFLAEPMSPGKLASVGLTMAGVAGLTLGADAGAAMVFSPLAIVCGLVAGFTYSLYYIVGKRFLSRYSTPTVFLYALPVGALGLSPLLDLQWPSAPAFAAVAFLSLVSTYGAYSFYYAGLKRMEASRAAVVATLEPVIAGVLAFFWWDERFTALGYIGACLVLAGVLLLLMDESSRAAPRSDAGQGTCARP